MKQLTDDLRLITSIDEIWEVRRIRFEQHANQYLYGEKYYIKQEFLNKLKTYFNEEPVNKYGIAVAIQDAENELKQAERGQPEPLHMAFSMITLLSDEQQGEVSEEWHAEKIKKLLLAGLTTGMMQGEVLGFIAQHPLTFRGMAEIMSELNSILENATATPE
jgi:hypothetical protein